MNSYWVPHAGSENHYETRKSLKICYFFNINQEQVYHTKISGVNELKRRIRVGLSESHGIIECAAGDLASASTRLRLYWRRTF